MAFRLLLFISLLTGNTGMKSNYFTKMNKSLINVFFVVVVLRTTDMKDRFKILLNITFNSYCLFTSPFFPHSYALSKMFQ